MSSIAFVDLDAQRQRIASEIDVAIKKVVNHGGFIMGPEVGQFEGQLTRYSGAKHAIACANGTDAISLCLMAEEIGPGDAVIVPSFTFIATAEAVAERLATPVFCDVSSDTFNIDAVSLERAIEYAKTHGLRPRAVISVDLFGLPADYDAVQAIAKDNGLVHISDAAQSFGATYAGKRVGTLADYTTTSFFPSKPLGCYGDGGAVFTSDDERAAVLKSLRIHGKGKDKYDNVRVGLNSRLDTIQAAILIEKLKIFDSELELRQQVANRYRGRVGNRFEVPMEPMNTSSAWAQYTLRLESSRQRSELQRRCKENGVPTAVYYPIPLHMQSGYKDLPRDPAGLDCAEKLSETVLSLPMHPYLSEEAQDYIVEVLLASVCRASD